MEQWPNPCRCGPGEERTGWHEKRSPECLAYERQQWADMLERVPAFIEKVKPRAS